MNGSESFWGYGRKEYFIGPIAVTILYEREIANDTFSRLFLVEKRLLY